ncbi:MAG: glycine/sarcosine/betaine reductase selenoprotein B family protein [bacterium]
MLKRRTERSFLSYIDLSREYYAAYGYDKPYAWISNPDVPFARLSKPLSECRVALVTTTDLEKLPGETAQERHLSRKVYAHPASEIPDHFYTLDLQWDQATTHTEDNDSFMPLNRLAECARDGKIGSASPRFYGVMTDYSQGKTMKQSAPRVIEFCREDGVDAVILPAL